MQNKETITTEVKSMSRSESVPAYMNAEVEILLESQNENKSITSPAESIHNKKPYIKSVALFVVKLDSIDTCPLHTINLTKEAAEVDVS